MFHSDVFLDCPHACAKYATELMIERFGIAATILRPNYFFQNDGEKVPKTGVYPMPIGALGVPMVDARDIAEVAALCLIERDSSKEVLPSQVIEIHGPDVLTSQSAYVFEPLAIKNSFFIVYTRQGIGYETFNKMFIEKMNSLHCSEIARDL